MLWSRTAVSIESTQVKHRPTAIKQSRPLAMRCGQGSATTWGNKVLIFYTSAESSCAGTSDWTWICRPRCCSDFLHLAEESCAQFVKHQDDSRDKNWRAMNIKLRFTVHP
eukprot:TRINITY_DN66893_c6_g15_i1.p1 TRINITY_DN66893_c6_g15~~TRINITY_DN66893_c6_g15_i1.p1  ORF type:complete len:110 (+),score=9.88 TRINITY_DN66893_c6_g15_i1:169-498(+)